MAVQVIGLQAKFDVKDFQTGLGIYLKGLEQATKATRSAAAAMNGLGTGLGGSFAKAANNLKAFSAPLSRINASMTGVSQSALRANNAFSQNKTILGAIQGELRDSVKLAETRAIIESRSTSEFQKQHAALQQQELAQARLSRRSSLRELGMSPAEINTKLSPAKNVKIDPAKDFNAQVLKLLGDEFLNTEKKANIFRRALDALGASSRSAQGGVKQMTLATTAMAVALGQIAFSVVNRLAQGLGRIASQGVETAAFFERLGLSINFFAARTAQQEDASLTFNQALAQTQREAQGVLLWVKQLAVASPFTAKQVGNVFRVSQAYGLLAEEARAILPLLLDVGAATGLDAQTLENAARALGQIRSRGKLTGEEIRQLGNAGIPIRDILVKQLQITNKEFDTLLESGALVSDLVIPAIVDSLKEFEGASEKVAFETIGGLLSAFQDIKEIGIAEFFSGLLKPIAPLLKNLVETLNSPEFRAILVVVGEDLGTVFTGAINNLTSAIGGLIKSWQQLSPETKRNIILFASAFAGIIVLIGAFSALFFVVTTLVNPLTITAALFAGFVTLWVNGFEGLASAAIAAGNAILAGLSALGRALVKVGDAIFAPIDSFLDWSGQSEEQARSAGRRTGEQYGVGLAEGGIVGVLNATNDIAKAITGQMEPKSPPPFLPEIDNWGRLTGELYGNAMGKSIGKSVGTSLERTKASIAHETRGAADAVVNSLKAEEKRLSDQGDRMGRSIGEGLKTGLNDLSSNAPGAIEAANGPVVDAAYTAGIAVGDAYTRGFGLLFRKPAEIIDPAIQELIAKIGGGRQLTRAGAESFTRFLDGFKDADFGALNDISGSVSSFIKNLVDIGDLKDIDIPRQMYKVREALAGSLQELRKFGSVSAESFGRVREAASPLGNDIQELLSRYQLLAMESENVRIAQERLNDVTEKYDNLLNPLKDELKAASEERQTAQEIKQIAGLQRIVNSSIVTAERKRIAAAEIVEIQIRQRVRALENEREKEEAVAKEAVDGFEKKEEAAKSEYDLFKQRLAAQVEQLGLVGEEAKIIERLQAELDKKGEKELSVLDRQLKFAALQKAELADNLAAAKARLVLEDETSSAQEKAAANLTLQTVALQRIQRESEATELGFKEEDLINLRDILVTLDDIGKAKKGDGGELEGTGLDTSLLEDPLKRLEEWETTTEAVKAKWDEWMATIREHLIWINERLPGFLKLFPESSSPEEVPIIESIFQIAGGIIAVGAAWKLVDFGGKMIFLLDKLKILAGISALGGSGGTIITFLGAIGSGSVAAGVGIAALGAAIATFLAALAFNWGGARDVAEAFFVDMRQKFRSNTIALQAWAEAAKQTLFAIFDPSKAIADVNYDEIYQRKLNEVNAKNLAEGNPFNKPEVRESFVMSGIDSATTWLDSMNASAADEQTGLLATVNGLGANLWSSFQSGWNDVVDANLGNQLGIKDLVKFDETTLQEASNVGVSVGTAIGDGIPAGLMGSAVADTSTMSADVVGALNDSLKSAAGIQSPSQLTYDEVGVPLGEGIRDGMLSVSTAEGTKELVNGIISKFDSLKTRAGTKFDQLNTVLGIKNKLLQTKLTTQTEETNSMILELFTTFVADVTLKFEDMFGTILAGWTTLGTESVIAVTTTSGEIVGVFQQIPPAIFDGPLGLDQLATDIVGLWNTIRLDQQTDLLGVRDDIVGIWVSDPDSIINQLRTALFGAAVGEGSQQSPVWSLGGSMMSGIAQGISDNAYLVTNSLNEAVYASLATVADNIFANSPSLLAAEMLGLPISQGVTAGVLAGAGQLSAAVNGVVTGAIASASAPLLSGGLSSALPSSINNISRTEQYNLNVNSASDSQGIINDFAIMRVMAAI